MGKTLFRGDAIKLVAQLDVFEQIDAHKRKHLMTREAWQKDATPPYRIFGCVVGIYMGNEYIPTHERGTIVQKMQHVFFFNNNKVFIDPRHIEVVASINDGHDEETL